MKGLIVEMSSLNLFNEADYIFKFESPSSLHRASATSPNLELPGVD
jgi:hypothetical protein